MQCSLLPERSCAQILSLGRMANGVFVDVSSLGVKNVSGLQGSQCSSTFLPALCSKLGADVMDIDQVPSSDRRQQHKKCPRRRNVFWRKCKG